MIRNIKILFFFITTFVLSVPVNAQTKIQVVTRTISRVFEYKPGCLLDIKGEKANIQVKKSVDNTVRVKILLIAKNPSAKIAETDLKYCNYHIDESSNGIAISNFFNIKDNYKEISSNLSAKYELEVPPGIILKLKNIYGDLDMNGVEGNFDIAFDFGQVKLSDIDGNLFINSNYSDIQGRDIGAIISVKAQKGDIVFTNIKSLIKIKDQYGSISLDNINANVDLDAEMTAINITVDNPVLYSLDFTVKEGEIIAPERYTKMVINKQGKNKLFTSGGKISIKVADTYNIITLKTKLQ
jgi:hypothetical protein